LTARDTLFAFLAVLGWGINFVVMKVGVHEIPPLLLLGLRFALVAVIVVPFVARPKGKLGLIALLALLLGAGNFGLLFIAMKTLDAASASITIQLSVPFSAIIAAVCYKETLGWLGVLGMALAYGGVALLSGEPQHPDPFAVALVVLSAASWALSNVVVKKIGDVDPLTLNGWMALAATPQLLLLSAVFEHDQWDSLRAASWIGWSALAYTVLVHSLLVYTLWYKLIARYPLNRVVPFSLMVPVVGIAAGVLMLGEPLGWHRVVGGALTVLGVAVIQFRPRAAGAVRR
jgi:O-acetylserine/cysteine efflux transporter